MMPRFMTYRTNVSGSRRGSTARLMTAFAGVVCLSVMVAVLAAGSAAAKHRCPAISVTGATVQVSVSRGHVSCRLARKVLYDFWHGRGRYHGLRDVGRSYTIVDGWRCPNISAGSSSCSHGRKKVRGTYPLGKIG